MAVGCRLFGLVGDHRSHRWSLIGSRAGLRGHRRWPGSYGSPRALQRSGSDLPRRPPLFRAGRGGAVAPGRGPGTPGPAAPDARRIGHRGHGPDHRPTRARRRPGPMSGAPPVAAPRPLSTRRARHALVIRSPPGGPTGIGAGAIHPRRVIHHGRRPSPTDAVAAGKRRYGQLSRAGRLDTASADRAAAPHGMSRARSQSGPSQAATAHPRNPPLPAHPPGRFHRPQNAPHQR